MVSELANRLECVFKEIAELEAKLHTRRRRAQALKKAVTMQERREARKLDHKMHKPKRMCMACYYRAV